MQISSGWGTSNSKFELNPPSRSQDMRLQSSSYFLRIFLFLLLFPLLFATLFKRFSKIKCDLLSRLQVKPLAWIGWKWICSFIKHWRINLWWEKKESTCKQQEYEAIPNLAWYSHSRIKNVQKKCKKHWLEFQAPPVLTPYTLTTQPLPPLLIRILFL